MDASENEVNLIPCIKNLTELTEFNEKIEKLRSEMSFVNFTSFSVRSTSLQLVIKLTFYSVLILLASIANLMVIFVIAVDKTFRKQSSLFIFNLAVCDLFVLLSCVWVQVWFAFDKYWSFGKHFCKINSFLQMFSIISSVLTLSAISGDRYIGIVTPLKAKQRRKSMYYVALGLIWTVSALVSSPTYIYRVYSQRSWSDFTENYCDDSGYLTFF
jgi:hypothetical protein